MIKRLTILLILLSCTIGIQAQTSKVNITIDGPGVVDEYLTTSIDGKKQVKLKAEPSNFLGKKVVGDVNGDGVVNVADIVELINRDGEANPEDIKAIVNIIMEK